MALFAKQFSLLLLLISLLSTHARDSQFFNKIPSTTNTNNVVVPNNNELTSTNQQQQPQPQQEDPTFLPETENSYGLYGHETGQLPPSTTTTAEPTTTTTATTPFTGAFEQPHHKYLPKNYNPVAYVTIPEGDVSGSTTSFEETSYTTNPNTNTNTNNNNNYYNGAQNYNNNNQQSEEDEYKTFPTTTRNNFYYNGGSSFNSQPQGLSADTRFGRGEANAFQPQGMSDTRLVENGRYFYDINTEKYSNNHPYESLRYNNNNNNRNYYNNANGENNAFEFNNENYIGGYNNQNQEEFQDEDVNMP